MSYTVYLAGASTPAATATATAAITSQVASGDTIILCANAGSGAGNVGVTSVSDTQGNAYSFIQQNTSGQATWQYICQDANALTTADSVTVTFTTATTFKELAVIGVHGAATTGPLVDQYAQAGAASGTTPSATTAALGSSSDLAVALFANGSGGGAPTLPGGWTQIAQLHVSGQAWLTVAYQVLSSSSALTASATITSAPWAAQVVTVAAQGALPTPVVYLAGANTPSASTTAIATISNAVTHGDTVVLCVSAGSAAGVSVSAVSDTQSNTYTLVQHSSTDQATWQYTCQNATALTTSDSVTVTFTSAATFKNLAVIGVHGMAASGPLVDQAAQAGGSSAAPSATTSPLFSARDVAVSLFSNGNGGGAPVLAGGWTQVAQVHSTGQQWLTVAYQILSSSAAVTASASITSTVWGTQVLTLAQQGALPPASVYLAGTNTPATGTTATVNIATPITGGDTCIVAASTGGSTGLTVELVSDTQGNHYVLAGTTITGQGMWIWYAQDATALTTSDSVTITFSNSADTKTMLVAGVHGAAVSGVIADSYVSASGSSASPSVTSAALGSSSDIALALFGNGNGGGSPILAGGWTQAGQAHGTGAAWLTLAYQVLASSSAATASATITSTGWAAMILCLAPQGLPARWLQSVSGAPTANQFQVVSKLAGATSVRLKVATDQALTQNVQFAAAQVPDSYGYVRHTAANLTPGTQYYYQPADTPSGGSESLLGPAGQCKTLPASGVPASFRMAVVSCVLSQTATDTAITDWVSWNPDLCCFTGDQNYWDTESTDLWTQVNLYELQIGNTGLGNGGGYPSSYSQMHGSHWGFYCRSDHEAGPDNGDSGPANVVPWIPVNISAALEVFPWATLGDISGSSPPVGLWQAWTAGRVRFIMPDVRNTDRSPGAMTDGPGKTMLGAPQLAWFYNQLLMPEPLKIIVEDTQWPGPASGLLDTEGPDKWWSYSTERSAIISFMQANAAQVGSVLWIHGDSHLVGVLDGADDSWGGFPVFCAAPQLNVGGGLNQQVWDAFYDNSGGTCTLYGRVTINDDGHTISVLQQGWDAAAQTVQVAQTSVFTCPPAARAVGGLGCAL